MEVKCPVSGCEDSEKEFKTEAALKSRTRNIHTDFLEEKDPTKEVPIIEKDFTTA